MLPQARAQVLDAPGRVGEAWHRGLDGHRAQFVVLDLNKDFAVRQLIVGDQVGDVVHRCGRDLFGVELEVPILAPNELYAGKLVAALDRQHPRDLFDVWQLYESGGISDGMVECFVVYLAGHNRPTHEVLFGNDKNIAGEYERAFVGMTEVDCSLETLLEARVRLRHELPGRLSAQHKQFLSGLTRAQPDWSLLQCQHAAQLPALRWAAEQRQRCVGIAPLTQRAVHGQLRQ